MKKLLDDCINAKSILIFLSCAALIAALFYAQYADFLPDRKMATHFNLEGIADAWMSSKEFFFSNILTFLFLQFVMSIMIFIASLPQNKKPNKAELWMTEKLKKILPFFYKLTVLDAISFSMLICGGFSYLINLSVLNYSKYNSLEIWYVNVPFVIFIPFLIFYIIAKKSNRNS